MTQEELRKLVCAYNRAKYALIAARDEMYPCGAKVSFLPRAFSRNTDTVMHGSLHADQVLTTNNLHVSLFNIEIVEPER